MTEEDLEIELGCLAAVSVPCTYADARLVKGAWQLDIKAKISRADVIFVTMLKTLR